MTKLNRTGCLSLLVGTLLVVTPAAQAGPEDNVRADLLSIEASDDALQASLDYAVIDLLPLLGTAVEDFRIEVGIDQTPDNGSDDIELSLFIFDGNTTGTTFAPHTLSADVSGVLDGLPAADRVQNGDKLVAMLDIDNSVWELFGAGEGDNAAAATPFYVDIKPKTLLLDAANQATLTYLVDAPAKIHGFKIQFWLDANYSGSLDGGDVMVEEAHSSGDTGIRKKTADFSGHVPTPGQKVFAVVDADNDVREAKEGGQNRIAGGSAAGTDLAAVSLVYDETAQQATLSYFVQSPTDVTTAYEIGFYLDNGDGSFGVDDVVIATVAGATEPGAHTVQADFSANPPASGAFIHAFVDNLIAIDELDEDNNLASAANTFVTDIVPIALTYDSNTQKATLAYLINSPTKVEDFVIRFFLDRNHDGVLNDWPAIPGGVSVVDPDTMPGARAIEFDYSPEPPASSQKIFAWLDRFNNVVEDDEDNKIEATNLTPTDLIAISLWYDSNTETATLSYAVEAPIPVPSYNIWFIRDTNIDLIAGPGDEIVSVSSQTAPGTYTQVLDFNAPGVGWEGLDAGQVMFAVIDPEDMVRNETVPAVNNKISTTNTDQIDIEAISLSYDPTGGIEAATLSYFVSSPTPVDDQPYYIQFMLDNGDGICDAASDTLVGPAVAVDPMPGGHVATQDLSGSSAALGQVVFAIIDPDNTLVESDESNNCAGFLNDQAVDLEAISLVYDAEGEEATFTYYVNSAVDVPAYNVMFVVDEDHNCQPNPGDTVLPLVAGEVTPGVHEATISISLAMEQCLFAVLDRPSPNVPELDETNNRATTRNTEITDLAAIALSYDPIEANAVLTYEVNSPVNVDAYDIAFLLDGGNGFLDGSDILVATVSGEVAPGSYATPAVTFGVPFEPASGQKVFAVIDLPAPGAVEEWEESLNNTAEAVNTAPTDLIANLVGSLTYDANLEIATLTYQVESPIPVPAYRIRFFLDNGNYLFGPFDQLVADVAGEVTPGLHSLFVDLTGTPASSAQAIFVVMDPISIIPWKPRGDVLEQYDFWNNVAATINTEGTDILANAVTVRSDDVTNPPNGETTATVAYTILSPLPVDPFVILVGIDRDGSGAIDDGANDLLATVSITDPADLTPGRHTIGIPDFRPVLNGAAPALKDGDQIIAMLDLTRDGTPVNDVDEVFGDETGNNVIGQTQKVDLVAPNGVTIVVDPGTQTTSVDVYYTVDSIGMVAPFDILVVLDRGGDGTVDEVLDTISVSGDKLRPGAQQVTSADIRGVLTDLQHGDKILALLDLDQDFNELGGVDEIEDVTNNRSSQQLSVDLVANAIHVLVDLNADATDPRPTDTEAEVTYTIDSVGSVAPFNIRIGLDRTNPGEIDELLDTMFVNDPTDLTPGTHTVKFADLRQKLNTLLTSPLRNGETIVATLDIDDTTASNEGLVAEGIEEANNTVDQVQTVDLVANSIAVTSDDIARTTVATISYTVNSPADVEAFDIFVGVDRGSVPHPLLDVIDVDGLDRSPGTHTVVSADLRAPLEGLTDRLQHGDSLIAMLDCLDANGDPVNAVIESAETDNNAASQVQTVDLVATAAELFTAPDSGEIKARVNYIVNSPGTAATFVIRVGIDRDDDRILDPGSALASIDVETRSVDFLRPGNQSITTDDLTAQLNGLDLQNGYQLIATLDLLDDGIATPENLVIEPEEQANNVARQPLAVDLVAISLAYDSNTNLATLSYSVNSVGGVPDYVVEFWLDADDDGLLDPVLDLLVETVTTVSVLPGERTVVGDYNLHTPRSQQYIFAVIDRPDPDDAVAELDEANNTAETNNTEITDLVANSITVFSDNVADETTASVSYTIHAPDSVNPFRIRVGVDRDSIGNPGYNVIDSDGDLLLPAPDFCLEITDPALLDPGSYTVELPDNLRPALAGLADRLQNGDRIIATLDLNRDGTPENQVVETGGDETGNNVAGSTVQVDLVATSVDVAYNAGTGKTVGRVNYAINTPGAVAPFSIRVGVDADADKIIDDGTLMAKIDLSADAELWPTDGRQTATPDLLPALNALPAALQNADRIIATLDVAEDGTAENAIAEAEDLANNVTHQEQTVDLVVQSIFLTVDNAANTTSATVTYTVNSIGRIAPVKLRIGVDRDSDGLIDSKADVLVETTLKELADRSPGGHSYKVANIRPALNALTPPLESGDRIIATLDLDLTGADEGAVVEAVEQGNNVTSTAGTQDQIVDIVADALDLDIGSYTATVHYTVTGPGSVAPFVIRLGRDTNGDDVIDDTMIDLPGNVAPGAHLVTADIADALRILGVAAGETVTIVADLDAGNAVLEGDEANNRLVEHADYVVDLRAQRLRHPCAVLDSLFDATFEYSVELNQPGEDFSICFYASADEEPAVSAGDVFLDVVVIVGPDFKTVGKHTVTIENLLVSSADFPTENFYVKARIDDAQGLAEADESNNVIVRPNAANDPSEDADGDGVPDCFDDCPNDPNKTSSGACGCGVPDTDADGDGVPNCFDECPDDPDKAAPGACGCGVADMDSDGDGVPDCLDGCPSDLGKTSPGICGCGVTDVDTDGDGMMDCVDGCPDDPDKTEPGDCGCGHPETDTDADGIADCVDPAPGDPDVPNPREIPPSAQPTPGDGGGLPFNVIWPLFPTMPPFPMCGIGLCGTGAMMPMGLLILGFAGMKLRHRRR
ncbi:MAG: hypothetical protein JXQ75_16950 [Phycisphaerae bacterium]|nr:hypothetical protein [Phycisphaerae bacterium]